MRRFESVLVLLFLTVPLSAQVSETPRDKEDEVRVLTKEIKELADQVRGQMKALTKTAVANKKDLEDRLGQVKQEIETARGENTREAQDQLRTLTRNQRDLEAEIGNRVRAAHGQAEETLRSLTARHDKLTTKLRALSETKTVEEAGAEFGRAKEESQRLLDEVLGKAPETPRFGNTVAPLAANGLALPPEAGAAPLAAMLRATEVRAQALRAMEGEKAAVEARLQAIQVLQAAQVAQVAQAVQDPAEPPQPARALVEAQLQRARFGAVPARPVEVGSALGGQDVVELRGEVDQLRKEIRLLRELVEGIVKKHEAQGAVRADAPRPETSR